MLSGKYLYDFKMTPNMHLSSGEGITISNTTAENCAKLCVQNVDFICKSFVFCGHTTCNILSVQPGNVKSQIGRNAVCDLYTSKLNLFS